MDTKTVGVRLRIDVWERYSAEAQSVHVPLGSLLRRRLEREDEVQAELAALRLAVERNGGPAGAGPGEQPAVPPGLLVEVLLLLRTLAGPQRAALAQREVERRGLSAWS